MVLPEFAGSTVPVGRLFLRGGLLVGVKGEGTGRPVRTAALAAVVDGRPERGRRRCTTLLPLVTQAPDQRDAGSCLYMALTGAAELALAQQTPQFANVHDGPLDLSERFTMALGVAGAAGLADWKTDGPLLLNGGAVLNRSCRFTTGWFRPDGSDGSGPNGSPSAAVAGEAGARYGCYANWLAPDGLATLPRVPLPRFDRQVLFRTPTNSPWATGCLDRDAVERVKAALRRHDRPVLAIYNHYGYWHAVLLVGYDDDRPSSAAFVERFVTYMREWADRYDGWGQPVKAARFRRAADDAAAGLAGPGGAGSGRGVFYVRDSIYSTPTNDLYDYDEGQTGEESPYASAIIERGYPWLMHLVNHLVLIRY